MAEVWRGTNYPGADRLAKLPKEKQQNKHIRRPQFVQLLSEQTAKEPIFAKVANELWQMDILDLSRHEKSNDGFKYLLACLDVRT